MTKSVLHFIDSGGLYGAENVILNLSSEMLDSDYKPIIGCIVQKYTQKVDLFDIAISQNIEAKKFVINNKRLLIDLIKVAFQIKRYGVSLIHSHGYKPSVFGFIIRLLTGIPVIATCHLWFTTDSPLKQKIMINLELFCYRFFPVIIAVSEPIKEILIKSKINNRKISVIKNGINLNKFHGSNHLKHELLRKEFGIPQGSFVILNIGRLTRQKAQHLIITAAKILLEKGQPVFCMIAGEGELKKDLELQIEENKIQDHVKLLGFQKDIKKIFDVSDIFILPSLDEGMPICLLEAIACKMPVITTPVGDIPKLIKDGVSGKIINIDDIQGIISAIEWIRSNWQESCLMATEAYKKLELDYSSKAMANTYFTIYRSLMINDIKKN
jgi:glycosyltransferase involved in cell wall biosynthesis